MSNSSHYTDKTGYSEYDPAVSRFMKIIDGTIYKIYPKTNPKYKFSYHTVIESLIYDKQVTEALQGHDEFVRFIPRVSKRPLTEQDIQEEFPVISKNFEIKNLTFDDLDYIATEYYENAVNFRKYINEQPLSKSMLMLCYILTIVSKLNTKCVFNHNDLHTGNILLFPCEPYKIQLYNTEYTLDHEFKIIDFDRSYMESLGLNMYLDNETRDCWSQSNSFNEHRDILKLLNGIYHYGGEAERKIICDSICVYEDDRPLIDLMFTRSLLLLNPYSLETIEKSGYFMDNVIKIPDDIIKAFYNSVKAKFYATATSSKK